MKKTKKATPAKITFKKPPLTEVVFGVQFEPLTKLYFPQVGQLWEKYKKRYPDCREQLAANVAIEGTPPTGPLPITIPKNPIMHRAIFATKDDSAVIQVQRDAFYFNWQKTAKNSKYPRYEVVSEQFLAEFAIFTDFISRLDLGPVVPTQCELTYLNEIPMDIGELEILRDSHWRPSDHKFLPGPDAINLGASFPLTGISGHLYSTFRNVQKVDGQAVYQWTLIARGTTSPPKRLTLDKVGPWFDNARKWVTNGFVDLSTAEAQKTLWERVS